MPKMCPLAGLQSTGGTVSRDVQTALRGSRRGELGRARHLGISWASQAQGPLGQLNSPWTRWPLPSERAGVPPL